MFVVELVFQTRQNRRCVGADVSLSTLTSSEQVGNWMVAYKKRMKDNFPFSSRWADRCSLFHRNLSHLERTVKRY
jgi:hypothetical protein